MCASRTEAGCGPGAGGSRGETDARVADFTRSIEIDAALAADDIAGSIAHVRGLGRAGILSPDETPDPRRRAGRARRRRRRGPPDLGPDARRRPHERRGGPGRRRSGRWPADSTRVARGTTRSPRTCGCGRAGRSTTSTPRCSTSNGRWSAWPSVKGRRSCPARPTSSRPSRCCSPTTCSPTSRWPSVTVAGWPMRARGSTSRRWGRARWPARATRSIARRRRPSSASMA